MHDTLHTVHYTLIFTVHCTPYCTVQFSSTFRRPPLRAPRLSLLRFTQVMMRYEAHEALRRETITMLRTKRQAVMLQRVDEGEETGAAKSSSPVKHEPEPDDEDAASEVTGSSGEKWWCDV